MMQNMNYADNSRRAIGAILLDCMRQASDNGLTINQLFEACRSSHPHLQSTKDIQPILQELAIGGFVKNLGERWKIAPPPTMKKNEIDATSDDIIPDTSFGSSGKASHPPTVQLPPRITLPGNSKFTSYKNTLQEYCQKVKVGVPKYHPTRMSAGLLGTVQFHTNNVQSKVATDTNKDADQRAAHQALVELGYLNEGDEYQAIASLKRGSSDMAGGDEEPPSKAAKTNTNPLTHKSMLNQLAQKNRLENPVYSCEPSGNGFVCTVSFNGRDFISERMFPKKRDAEQNAAYMAMKVLTGLDANAEAYTQSPSKFFSKAVVSDMISEARSQATSDGNDDSFENGNSGIPSLKNRLQEYCQRLKKSLPFYQTIQNEDTTYTSMVTVEEKSFTGQASKGKKGAERAAAESALKALGLMAES